MSLFSNLSESALTETSYNFKGILIKFRVVSHDLLSTDKRQFLSFFSSNLKMTDEKKHQNVLENYVVWMSSKNLSIGEKVMRNWA